MNEKVARKIFGDWYGVLRPVLASNYFKNLIEYLQEIYKKKAAIYPKQKDVFKAFRLTKYRDLKVVIIGHCPPLSIKANGLAFGNSLESPLLSPSLMSIKKNVEEDYYNGLDLNFDTTLESWAKQGVLLLNSSLTIEAGTSKSHVKQWDVFIKYLLETLSENNPGIVYCLWGNYIKKYKKHISDNNYIIEAEHPLELSYKGNRWDFSFKKIDKITKNLNNEIIKW